MFFFLERRSISQDVSLDIKIGIEAKNYEGVSTTFPYISYDYSAPVNFMFMVKNKYLIACNIF